MSKAWSPPAGLGTAPGPSMTGTFPRSAGNLTGIPMMNNQSLPGGNFGYLQPPGPSYPSAQQSMGPVFDPYSGNYATTSGAPLVNQSPGNLLQNTAQAIQNEAQNRRLTQLEDENSQRRNATMSLQQMGTQLLQGQMDVQEQVLQYQFMLEQCMETLDHQNFILNGQAEELAVLRGKLRHYEYLMDAIKQSIKGNRSHESLLQDLNINDFKILNYRNPFSFNAPPGSPLSTARVTASKFQPLNPTYRPPVGPLPNFNETRNLTPSTAY